MSNIFGPASEKQKMFLNCKADIVIYGGGGQKRLHLKKSSLIQGNSQVDNPERSSIKLENVQRPAVRRTLK